MNEEFNDELLEQTNDAPKTCYFSWKGKKYIFRKTGKHGGWQYHGWYNPKLDRVLD